MLRPIGELNRYQYIISDMIISISGDTQKYVISNDNLRYINITHSYLENISPIIEVGANVPKEIYKKFTKLSGDISVTVIIHKVNTSSAIKAKELVFSKTYSVLTETEVQPDDMKMFEDTVDVATNTISSKHTDQLVNLSFYLIDKDKLTKYKKCVSYFLNGATLTDCIALMFSDRGFDSVIMNQIPNDIQSNKNIPFYNLMNSIEYLNNKYGLFNSGYIFYMDIIDNYLLDMINVGKAVKTGVSPTATLYLETYGSLESSTPGSAVYNNNHIINMVKPPLVNKIDTVAKYISGTNIISINTNDVVSTLSGDIDNPLMVFNDKIPRQIQHNSNESKVGLSIAVPDIDISAIGPNIKYTIIANYAYNTINNINGDYRLNSSTLRFEKMNGEYFGLVTGMDLMKIQL